MSNKVKIYQEYNLQELNLLPTNWDKDLLSLANSNSYLVHLDGKSSTSREPSSSEGADVLVVDGEIIAKKLTWLESLYKNELLELANRGFNNKYTTSNSIQNGININYLKGANARYEWHVDSNPLTGILYATTHNQGDGGELIFDVNGDVQILYPSKGLFILFDAREIPHTVMPLKVNTFRISVPMNFYFENEEQKRPSDLDSYIYKK